MKTRLAVVTSHPIQYQAPWFRELAKLVELRVYFAHRQTSQEQADAGYGVAFDWDVNLLDGYDHAFLENRSRRPGTGTFFGCDTPSISRYLAETRPQAVIVMGWQLKCYWQAARACHALRIPVLVRGDSHLGTKRSFARRAAKEVLYRPLLAQFDGFLCVGTRNREYLRHYGVPSHKLLSAPHCIDTEHFRRHSILPAEERAAERERLGLHRDAFVIASVGRLIDSKRPLDVIRAVARVSNAGEVQCLFVGAGPAEGELRREANALGVTGAFSGFVNQARLPRMYGVADVVAMTSSETWGLVVNEAAACGVPAVVSTDVGCGPDMIVSGTTGEIYDTGNVSALAAAIERVRTYRATSATTAALASKSEQHSCAQAALATVQGIESVLRRW